MKLLLVGSTGLVGQQVIKQALANSSVTRVTALTRRPVSQLPELSELSDHPKLKNRLVDFDQLSADEDYWQADAVICTLGTTIKIAGSQDAFYRVDHDYPLKIAELANQKGTRVYALNSAMGANPESRIFYNRVKGELERDLQALGFESLALVRPGLIGGHRHEFRIGELLGKYLLTVLGPLLPKALKINPPEKIADSLLNAVIFPEPGTRIIHSRDLV